MILALVWVFSTAGDTGAVEKRKGDLSVGHFEITQGLQNAANGVPLIAGKRTIVRVFPRVTMVSSQRLSGCLFLARSATDPPTERRPENGIISATGEFDRRDRDGDTYLHFELPEPWTSGVVHLWVELPVPLGLYDYDPENNRFPEQGSLRISFHSTKRVRIGFLIVEICDRNGCRRPRRRVQTDQAVAWLAATFPVDPENVEYYPFRHNSLKSGLGGLLKVLENEIIKAADPPDVLYAWVPGGAGSKSSDGKSNSCNVAWGKDRGIDRWSSRWRRTLAHEVTHCLTQNPSELANPPRRMDDRLVGELGFDVEGVDPFDRRVMLTSPGCHDRLFDLMVRSRSEREAWITETTYLRLFDALRTDSHLAACPGPKPHATSIRPDESGPATGGSQAHLETTVQDCDIEDRPGMIVVRGQVRPDGGEFLPFLDLQSPNAERRIAERKDGTDGPFEIRLFAGHRLCESVRWQPAFDESEEPTTGEAFAFPVRRYRNLDRVELLVPGRAPVVVALPTILNLYRQTYSETAGSFQRLTPRISGVEARVDPENKTRMTVSWQSNLSELSGADPEGDSVISFLRDLPVPFDPWIYAMEIFAAPDAPAAHHVYYTRDRENWQLLAADLEPGISEVELDVAGLPAVDDSRLKVVARYGVQTAEDEVVLPPRENQPPLAMIVVPVAEEVRVLEGKEIRLVGAGYDPEDGKVPGEALTWTITGHDWTRRGSETIVRGLPEGRYEVRLVARDSAPAPETGVSRAAKRVVRVLPRP